MAADGRSRLRLHAVLLVRRQRVVEDGLLEARMRLGNVQRVEVEPGDVDAAAILLVVTVRVRHVAVLVAATVVVFVGAVVVGIGGVHHGLCIQIHVVAVVAVVLSGNRKRVDARSGVFCEAGVAQRVVRVVNRHCQSSCECGC
ncbi:hypothetical protein GQ42DRAFT_155425 [Ramicandelaber brevisporus]|nr:hypothetical protein GQ42DRAFT_155425 [Ramicandelaber brevisporus]